MKEEEAINLVIEELRWARKKFDSYNSFHEGYAVILEEMDELWEQIKGKPIEHAFIKSEVKQVATTAVRFLIDLFPSDSLNAGTLSVGYCRSCGKHSNILAFDYRCVNCLERSREQEEPGD